LGEKGPRGKKFGGRKKGEQFRPAEKGTLKPGKKKTDNWPGPKNKKCEKHGRVGANSLAQGSKIVFQDFSQGAKKKTEQKGRKGVLV